MDNREGLQQERDFLQAQLAEIQHKIARLQSARRGSHNALEAEGLDARLRAAETERALILSLLEQQQHANPGLPLRAALMAQIRRLEAATSHPALRWRRGRPTSPQYWEAARQRTFLEQLLRRFNSWEAGRPYYPLVANGTQSAAAPAPRPGREALFNPWGAPPRAVPSEQANDQDKPNTAADPTLARRAELIETLARAGIDADHVEIILENEPKAIVIAFAHNEDERVRIINTLLAADYVEAVLADIQVNDPRWCPVCRARERKLSSRPESSSGS